MARVLVEKTRNRNTDDFEYMYFMHWLVGCFGKENHEKWNLHLRSIHLFALCVSLVNVRCVYHWTPSTWIFFLFNDCFFFIFFSCWRDIRHFWPVHTSNFKHSSLPFRPFRKQYACLHSLEYCCHLVNNVFFPIVFFPHFLGPLPNQYQKTATTWCRAGKLRSTIVFTANNHCCLSDFFTSKQKRNSCANRRTSSRRYSGNIFKNKICYHSKN